MNEKGQQECLKCGECCKWLTFSVSIPPNMFARYLNYYKTHGCRIIKVKKDQGHIALMVPSVCHKYSFGQGCVVYNDRPQLCRLYDGRNDPNIRCQMNEEKT